MTQDVQPWYTALSRTLTGRPPALNLALQGGGAHGAFTWGVLEALLNEPNFHFEGISGTSAGAMNAVLFAEGWRKGGREGALELLESFWLSCPAAPCISALRSETWRACFLKRWA